MEERDGGCLSYIYDPSASTKDTPKTSVGFCLFSLLRRHRSLLHPERRHAPANGRAGLRNPSPLGSCTGRGRIRFLGSASHDCSRSSSRCIFRPTPSPHGPTAFIGSSSGGSSSSTLQPRLSTCSVICSISSACILRSWLCLS